MPLILKVNGRTDVPPSDDALSTTNSSVEDAVRLGADAVGYTMYLGSPLQTDDLHQLKGVREDCDRYGMPLSSGPTRAARAIDKKGGRDSFYAIDYAARMAMEMGADVVKLNMPKLNPENDKDSPAPYNEMQVDQEEAIQHCVASAGRSLVVLSGGSKTDDDKLLGHVRSVMGRPAARASSSAATSGSASGTRRWRSSGRSRRSCSPRSAGPPSSWLRLGREPASFRGHSSGPIPQRRGGRSQARDCS